MKQTNKKVSETISDNLEDDLIEELTEEEKKDSIERTEKLERYGELKYGSFWKKIKNSQLVCEHCKHGSNEDEMGVIQWDMAVCPRCNEKLEESKEEIYIKERIKSIKEEVSWHFAVNTKKSKESALDIIYKFLREEYYIKYTKADNEKHRVCYIYVPKTGKYIPGGESFLIHIMERILKELYTTTKANVVLNRLYATNHIDEEHFLKVDDDHKILVKNGIFNIRDWKLEQFTHKEIYTNNVEFKIETLDIEKLKKSSLKAEKFLKEKAIPDDKERTMFKEWCGSALIRNYRHQKACMLIGNGGNGKGLVSGVLSELFGSDMLSGYQLNALCQGGFEASELHNKIMNVTGDLPEGPFENIATFKVLTGEDLISANRKFLLGITFKNYAKILTSCNALPIVPEREKNIGFYRRWHLIHFPISYDTKEEVESKKEYTQLRVADEGVKDMLHGKEFLSSFRDWILVGLYNYRKNNYSFTCGRSPTENKEIMEKRQKSFENFFIENLEYTNDINDCVLVEKINKKYAAYCSNNNLETQKVKEQKRYLQEEFDVYSTQKKIDGKNKKVYSELRFL